MCTSWKDYPRLLHWLLRLSVQEQSHGDFEPGGQKRGWLHEAASRVDLRFRDEDLFHRVPAPVRALIRSQGGPISPMSHLTRLEPHLFRTILLRRLRQPLPRQSAAAGVAVHLIPVPPPCSLCSSWGLGEERFCGRECDSPHLS